MSAIEQDSLELAERYLHEALKLDPANPHNALLFSNLGTVQRRQQRYELALESYTMALNMAPRAVSILLNRAALYLELGRNNQACADYSLALDMEPDNREALLMRAYIFQQDRDYKAARADYERLLKSSPSDYNGRLGLATLERKSGRLPEALLLLNGMITDIGHDESYTDNQRATLYTARAGIEQEQGQTDAALLDLEESIRLDDSQPEAYLMRGQIYLARKKKEAARSDFEKSISLGIPAADMRDLLRQCK